ncbi:MAG TPA: iron-containing alcohol dehydrogenase [Candidatus Binatia bacterium]|nr:iron-containing alcohol dehydrogenase [Candidatus Binatia bacterium]
MPTNLALPRIMRVGGGALAETGGVLKALGLSKPLIVTDPFLEQQGTAARLKALLEQAGIATRTFARVVPDPTTTSVGEALAFLQAGDHDSVIGLGGGSPIDTAKAIAVLTVTGGEMRALRAPHQQDEAGLPIVAIPTTAGTGSEATRFTIITDEASNEKMLCIGLAYLPIAAIVDFELTLSMPKRLTADTGVDALTHAIEAYVSRRANPFTDDLSLIAMRAIWENIRTVYGDPADRGARERMMLGATQAGIAFSNSSVALVHGMSRPIGAFFHIAHGLSNAMLLPTATAYSAEAAVERYADCARVLGLAKTGESNDAAARRLVEALYVLNADLEVPSPQRLSIDERRWNEVKETMALQALASGSPGNNPRVPSAEEIVHLYDAVWNATRVRL